MSTSPARLRHTEPAHVCSHLFPFCPVQLQVTPTPQQLPCTRPLCPLCLLTFFASAMM